MVRRPSPLWLSVRASFCAVFLVVLCVVPQQTWAAATTLYFQNTAAPFEPTVKGTYNGTCSGTPIYRMSAAWKEGAFGSTTIRKTDSTGTTRTCRVAWPDAPLDCRDARIAALVSRATVGFPLSYGDWRDLETCRDHADVRG